MVISNCNSNGCIYKYKLNGYIFSLVKSRAYGLRSGRNSIKEQWTILKTKTMNNFEIFAKYLESADRRISSCSLNDKWEAIIPLKTSV